MAKRRIKGQFMHHKYSKRAKGKGKRSLGVLVEARKGNGAFGVFVDAGGHDVAQTALRKKGGGRFLRFELTAVRKGKGIDDVENARTHPRREAVHSSSHHS